jgi:hypothetical protein
VKQKYTPDVFVDYGQCGRLSETVDSQWWDAHRTSFFARQQFSYERGLGWSFAAWKLYDNDNYDHHNRKGGLTEPERLLSLKDVVAAGLVPAGGLHNHHHHYACLNPPANDFILGDTTLAPVPAPPPIVVMAGGMKPFKIVPTGSHPLPTRRRRLRRPRPVRKWSTNYH